MNYYEVLELVETASQEDIEKAYRKKALQYHPDRNPGNTEVHNKFISIQAAYENLRDPEKRRQYDYGRKSPSIMPGFDFFEQENLDIKVTHEVSILDILTGCEKTISINKKAPCIKCHGFGASSFRPCDSCNGAGHVVNALNNIFRFQTLCGRCMGHGKLPLNKCDSCHGSKKQNNGEEIIQFTIPKGLQHGMTMCLKGQGNIGHGRVGDLYLQCVLQTNNQFRVEGLNVFCNVNAKYSTMLFGGKIVIPTPENDIVEIEVPRNTPCLTKLTVKNKGLYDFRNTQFRGDLIATVMAEIPQKINDEQRIKEFLISHDL